MISKEDGEKGLGQLEPDGAKSCQDPEEETAGVILFWLERL